MADMLALHRLLALLLLWALSYSWAEPQIRVLLDEAATAVTVWVEGGHRGYVDGVARFETTLPLKWPVSVSAGQLWIEGQVIGRTLQLTPLGAAVVALDGQRYRGSLTLIARGDRLQIINTAGLEDYLRGVVPAEMYANWPLEALKAQAVAARSYTLASLSPEREYDICATVECQVYRGMDIEHPRTDEAVAATRGLVLTYGGGFARTYYHSDSGGFLASSAEVWGARRSYLPARPDVAAHSPHRRWQLRLDPTRIALSLQAQGVYVGRVTALRILALSESGRVQRAEIGGERGRVVLSGTMLTALLRSWGLKSTRFVMNGDLLAYGDGWGHGVGMSQHGARSLAAAGHRFDEILAFYFPGTRLQVLPYQR